MEHRRVADASQAHAFSLPPRIEQCEPPANDHRSPPPQHAVVARSLLAELCRLCDDVAANGRCSLTFHDTAPETIAAIAAHAGILAVSQRGCLALTRAFKGADASGKRALVAHLLPRLAVLSMDVFANYMVQCVVEHSDRATAAQYVAQFFAGHLLQMSCDKFASNVVEKVVRVCGGVPAVRRLLLDELIFDAAAAQRLVSDVYGNFVVQRLVSTVPTLAEMCAVLRAVEPLLLWSPYATNIGAKLTKRRQELEVGSPAPSLPYHHPQHPAIPACAPHDCDQDHGHVHYRHRGTPAAPHVEVECATVRYCGRSRYMHAPYDANVLAEGFTTAAALHARPNAG